MVLPSVRGWLPVPVGIYPDSTGDTRLLIYLCLLFFFPVSVHTEGCAMDSHCLDCYPY